jgi:hypothetical protein
LVDSADHVFDDFRRRVPNAKLGAQHGVESLKERLVEKRDGVVGVERFEERNVIDAVEARRSPFQWFAQVKLSESLGFGNLVE